MNKRINILNTFIDNLSMDETVSRIENAIENKENVSHVVVNAAKIVALQRDRGLAESVNSCDLINADGQSVIWASSILKQPLKERVAGIDLMERLVKLAYKKKYKIFFLGAKEEVVKKVVEHYASIYSKDLIAGYRNGYFNETENYKIAQSISDSNAQMLFVAISSPKKENFLFKNRETLANVNFTMGVGGSFDVVAGIVNRAPLWMQKNGLEWFYRFVQEPKRMWKRYLFGNSKFLKLLLKEKLRNGR